LILGQCNRCGKCCEEYYRFYRIKRYDKVNGETMRAEIKPKIEDKPPCHNLIFDSQTHLAVCTRQEEKVKKELWFCREFPLFKEEIIYPTCGYYFEED
jgi:hypothetical protein